MFQNVLLVGATSGIGRELGARLTKPSGNLYLASRNLEEQARVAADLRIRHGFQVFEGRFEAGDFDSHAELAADVQAKLGRIDCVLVATGELGDPLLARTDFTLARRILESNFTGPASLLTHVAAILETQRSGQIIVLSSVAGERGRQSNYPYGAAKAGINVFLQGLRNRLCPAGVRVLTVKLGFTDTRMTFGKSGMFLVISPAEAASGIARHVRSGSDEAFVPAFWRPIMFLIRMIPEPIFKRLKL